MLIDSGSSLSLASEKTAKKLEKEGVEVEEVQVVCRGLNGRIINIKRAVTLEFEQIVKPVTFYVCPAEFDANFLLGSEDLVKLEAKLDFIHHSITFKKRKRIFFVNRNVGTQKEEEEFPSCRVLLKEGCVLPPMHRGLITGIMPKYHTLEMPGNQATETETILVVEPVGMGSKLMQMSQLNRPPEPEEEPQIVMVLYNLSDKELVLKKNTCIARAELLMARNVDPQNTHENTEGNQVNWMKQIPFSEDRFEKLWGMLQKDHLPKEEIPRFKELIKEFADVFCTSPEELGRTSWIEMEIDTGESKPIRDKRWAMSFNKRQIVRDKIKELLEVGIIERLDTSPWLANLVLVPKKDGKSIRVAVDYRNLNNVTVPMGMPSTHIPELLEGLAGKKIFSSLDLESGYNQIPLAAADQAKTSFCTDDGVFCYKVMPFGLSGAPALFSALVRKILDPIPREYRTFFIDDILAFTKTYGGHYEVLRQIFQRLRAATVRANPRKCLFLADQLEYLSHTITAEGITPSPRNIDKIRQMKPPQNVKQLQTFLGACSWLRKYIEGFSGIAAPLNKLVKKDVAWKWTEEQQQAFETLRARIISPPVLAHPNPNKDYILAVDASTVGLGACLSQLDEGGKRRVISYASRTLTKPETNYCIYDLEMLAAVFGIKAFAAYLSPPASFTLETDCQSLTSLRYKTNPSSGRMARWLAFLSPYKFTIKYVPGRHNVIPDALSRLSHTVSDNVSSSQALAELEYLNALPDEDGPKGFPRTTSKQAHCVKKLAEVVPEEPFTLVGFSVMEFVREYKMDPIWKSVVEHLQESSKAPKDVPVPLNTLYLTEDGLLMYCPTNKVNLLVVPRSLVGFVISAHHHLPISGHMGEHHTLAKIRERYYWPGMQKSVINAIKGCLACHKFKYHRKHTAELQHMKPIIRPSAVVCFDVIGPIFPPGKDGQKYILSMMCHLTKYLMLVPLQSQQAEDMAEGLLKWITLFGTLEHWLCDNFKTHFGKVLTTLNKKLNIQTLRTSPMHSQTNFCERAHRTLEPILRILASQDQHDWPKWVPFVAMAINASVSTATGYSPNELFFGRQLKQPYDLVQTRETPHYDLDNYALIISQRLRRAYQLVAEKMEANADKMDEAHQGTSRQYEIGRLVMLKKPQGNKLDSLWDGPFTVIARQGAVNYKLQSADGKLLPRAIHFNRLRAVPQVWTPPTLKELPRHHGAGTKARSSGGAESSFTELEPEDSSEDEVDGSIDFVPVQNSTQPDSSFMDNPPQDEPPEVERQPPIVTEEPSVSDKPIEFTPDIDLETPKTFSPSSKRPQGTRSHHMRLRHHGPVERPAELPRTRRNKKRQQQGPSSSPTTEMDEGASRSEKEPSAENNNADKFPEFRFYFFSSDVSNPHARSGQTHHES